MTIIVQHRRTENQYILLGINGEMDKANPSRFISELFNQEKSEVSCSATVCDVQGNIFLAYIDDLKVIEIDGKKLIEILPEASYESEKQHIYGESSSEFENDDELEDENFATEEDIAAPRESQTSFVSGLGVSISDDTENDQDNEDWI